MPRDDTRSLVLLSVHPLAVTYVLGAAARLLAIVVLGHAAGADTVQYRDAADAVRRSLLDGGRFADYPPLFPLLLAIVPSDRAAAVVQALIGASVAPLLFLTVRRHAGTAAAWVAGILAATEPHLLFWSRYLLTETIALAAFALALERASALADPDRRGALGAGAASALAFLARGAFLLPALVIAALAIRWGSAPMRRAATFALGAALVLAIPTARNVIASGEPVPYRDQGLLLVWLGIQWNEAGRSTEGIDVTYPPGYASWDREERVRFFRDEVVRFVTSHPLEYVGLMSRKLLWFWLPAFPEWSTPHKLLTGGYMTLLYATAAVGALRLGRRRLGILLLGLLFAIQATVVLTVVDYDNRYRLPAELCLLPFAAVGIVSVAKGLRNKSLTVKAASG